MQTGQPRGGKTVTAVVTAVVTVGATIAVLLGSVPGAHSWLSVPSATGDAPNPLWLLVVPPLLAMVPLYITRSGGIRDTATVLAVTGVATAAAAAVTVAAVITA